MSGRRLCEHNRVIAVAVAIGMSVALAAPPTAASTSAWHVQPHPRPQVTRAAQLKGISCPDASHCLAVGMMRTPNGALPIVERWSASQWTVVAAPEVGTAQFSGLGAVQCFSTTHCIAVGNADTNPLIAVWNGTSWHTQPAHMTDAVLDALSCTSATSCIAVGAGGSAEQFFAHPRSLRFDGSAWTPVSTPVPGGDTSVLNGVACTAPTSCVAVGYYTTSDWGGTFAEHWNGTKWTVKPATATYGNRLNAVACTSASNCHAVGTGDAFLMHWNGTTWSQEARPAGAAGVLESISCLSASNCTAVGSSATTSALILHWNGSSWSSVPSPAIANHRPTMWGVSCPTKVCLAVGADGTDASVLYGERFEATSWTLVPVPAPTGDADATLDDVSCPTANFCMTVGSSTDQAGHAALLVERWSGTAWSPAPAVTVGDSTSLVDVFCNSSTDCYAAGSSSDALGIRPVLEHWNGSKWSLAAVPLLSGDTNGALTSITCVSAVSCMAVGGSSQSTTPSHLIVERGHGTNWSVRKLPTPAGATYADLESVACASTTFCVAVGQSNASPNTEALVERWTGSSWTIAAVPPGPYQGLNGVACASPTSCTAVGGFQPSSNEGDHPFVVHWNGTAWSQQTTPKAAPLGSLDDVSCPAPTRCVAVGVGTTSVLLGNGSTWSVQQGPKLLVTGSVELDAVSCPHAATCVAVGVSVYDAGYPAITHSDLIERHG